MILFSPEYFLCICYVFPLFVQIEPWFYIFNKEKTVVYILHLSTRCDHVNYSSGQADFLLTCMDGQVEILQNAMVA